MRAITVLFYSCFPLAILASSAAAQTLTEQLVAEGVTRVASAAREKGDAVRGAIIFSQQKMNCVKCHQTGAQDLLGPDLTQLSRETTDVYIVESLLMPSKVIKEGYGAVKILTEDGIAMTGRVLRQDDQTIVLRDNSESGRQITLAKETLERLEPSELSAMPADLANQLSNRQQFLDLSKYLMDLAASSDPSGRSIELRDIDTAIPDRLHGIALIDRLRCVGCHDGELQQPVPFAAAPDLSNASARIDPEYLKQYIQDPHRLKPGTSMPNVMGHLDESTRRENVEAIVAYLQSRSEGTFHRDAVDDAAAKRGEQTFHEVGCVACHSPRDASGKETLETDSAALGDVASKYSLASLTQFLEDPHAIRPSGRMPNLKLTHWEAVDLASYLISNPSRELKQNSATEHDSTSTLDPKLVKRGAQSYVALGCAFCHESEIGRPVDRPFASLSDLPQQLNSGCLSSDANRRVRYELSESQKESIVNALANQSKQLTMKQQLTTAMVAMRCYQCHQRDGVGGVSIERDPYFQSDDPNLGPQGRIPPTLTNVGSKLKPKWMRQVLVSGRAIRPYVKTRMPQYGLPNIEPLIDLFQESDELSAHAWAEIKDVKEAKKIGSDLVGSNGLNCVACHTFQQKPAQTMQAVDLTEMAERLQRDWFEIYMRNPQTLSPGTVMPSFWPGGKAIRSEILDGDTDQQIATLWTYLQDGRQARQPRGVVIEPMELLAGKEAVMLRRNYQGIGRRGIGVGYSSKVNLTFDAEQLRLASLWRGEFVDPGAAWRGQGSGSVRPLSRDVTRFPSGPDLDSVANPWIVDEGRPPRHQFKGYRLDSQRRPAFRYRFDEVDVEDYLVDRGEIPSSTVSLRRSIRLTTAEPRDGLRFRIAASDKAIEQVDDSTFRLSNGLRVQVLSQTPAEMTEADGRSQLVIPLNLPAGDTVLEVSYQW